MGFRKPVTRGRGIKFRKVSTTDHPARAEYDCMVVEVAGRSAAFNRMAPACHPRAGAASFLNPEDEQY